MCAGLTSACYFKCAHNNAPFVTGWPSTPGIPEKPCLLWRKKNPWTISETSMKIELEELLVSHLLLTINFSFQPNIFKATSPQELRFTVALIKMTKQTTVIAQH